MHSMAVREKPLQPWAIIESKGNIIAAHCTCMAGLGEACTHVAAMLWSICALNQIRKDKSVTDTKSYWMPCSAKGSTFMGTIANTDFTSSKTQKKFFDKQFTDTDHLNTTRVRHEYKQVDEALPSEIENFCLKLEATKDPCSILATKKNHQSKFKPKLCSDSYPKLLSDLFDKSLIKCEKAELLQHCAKSTITVTEDEANKVYLL